MNLNFLVRVAFLLSLVFIVQSCKNDPVDSDKIPVSFAFSDNLSTVYGQSVPLKIQVLEKDISKLELVFEDSVFQTWTNPQSDVEFTINLTGFGVGAKSIKLVAQLADGTEHVDQRIVRILSDISPESKTAKIVNTYPHNSTSFTQGLEFYNNILYESTGDPNRTAATMVAQVELETGKIINKNGLDASFFGEGITIMDGILYQLTWTQQKCFMYDSKTLEIKSKEFTYTGEGWGLANDGKNLIMSDGTERLVFRDPKNFQVVKTIEVYDNVGPRSKLNELEYIDGKLYANVWMLDIILEIDPETGKVLAEIDATSAAALGRSGGDVLNGIAHNPSNKKTYLTGKYWSKLFEVVIE
ncbi:MAG: glutaminyl-peptide cyclotransferase [Crocinitomicaceae bacterium]|nr:glutaminyl-peptide cyclotransferase [Crocinitomicaceae bacterium]